MAVPAEKFRTIVDASALVTIYKSRMQLMGTALADALLELQSRAPGCVERATRILTKAREEHLNRLTGAVHERTAS